MRAVASGRRLLWAGAAAIVLAAAGCGGTAVDAPGEAEQPLADGLALLPDAPGLRRHVLVGDLARLRRAYPQPAELREALVGVWLPDALVGADTPLWRASVGLQLAEITSFASAGFHPALVTVAQGRFSPARIRGALGRAGYQASGSVLAHGADGSIDASTDVGRLVLSALNRVTASTSRVVAASSSSLQLATDALASALSDDDALAAAAAALDPVTSATLLDAELVRPATGAPTAVVPAFPARLVGAGVDDLGPERRTLKLVFVYDDTDQARSDAELIERALPDTPLGDAAHSRFSDLAPDWRVSAEGRTVRVTALLPPGSSAGTWRTLVERGDLAAFVRPE